MKFGGIVFQVNMHLLTQSRIFKTTLYILGAGHDIISRPPFNSIYACLLTHLCCLPAARRVHVKSVPDP